MSLSRRANEARRRYARVQRWVDATMIAVEVMLLGLVVLAVGRLLGVW